mmetsp:Transcript_58184/g.96460  ORF Transcript_58184/g.96460 Transcript_58184/m.96460 type:complete len:244 (+) Transcript_58184:69-800(+)|eukprot:CAMPEP_0202688018 /NCGR_PEP_ID=MMETSP1385-20130828/3559_1 /ASSEMBLY_ACC=CAM_ASM_000861 /TAXON_ID=933848 /ORGANISM="Elphidium margaritaceum" /LENGTH=243 /DNA_ID=CAMNT_0049342889 /DNA_START=42 /DNA_END=773 /DNA_ORIENTATION=-
MTAAANPKHNDTNDDDDNDILTQKQFKFVVLGDGAVGKTSICHRFVEDHFANSYKQTIGLDFFVKRLTMNDPSGGKIQIALQLWDIGGQSVSSKMITKYIHGANAILLVYDITNHDSFENIRDWLAIAKQSITQTQTPPYMVLVGNKYDLQHLKTVKVVRHKELCDKEKLESCYASAKTGDGLHTMFYHITAKVAGIKISKTELETEMKVVSADIIDHEQNDPAQKTFQQRLDAEKKKDCIVL